MGLGRICAGIRLTNTLMLAHARVRSMSEERTT